MADSSDSDFDDLVVLGLAIGASIVSVHAKKYQKVNRRKTRQWLNRRQEGKGILHMLNNELLVEDPSSYHNYLRMDSAMFQKLLDIVEIDISKMDTFMRDAIPARSRLEVTLRFLATGESYRSLMYATRIHESTISRFIPHICQTIYRTLKESYLKMPTTEMEWEKISDEFYERWDFPNCVGALDGRHIKFKPAQSNGSYFFNYKGTHSIVLLALVDACYKFIYINVGINGRISDGGVFRESSLCQAIESNSVCFPSPKALPFRTKKVPYVIIADDAFPLTDTIMKPYPLRNLTHECRIFNYRLSRARRMVESAFGILANRFRVLLNPINLCAEKVEQITACCVVLHNFLINDHITVMQNDEAYEDVLEKINVRQAGNRSSNSTRAIRDEFKEFFNGAGARDWQNEQIHRNNM